MSANQELISISVIGLICICLFFFCLFVWLIRCRRDQQNNREKKSERERELNEYENNSAAKKQKGTPFNQRKVHEVKKKPPKKQESADVEKGGISVTNSSKKQEPLETIQQFENRIKAQTQPEDSVRLAKRNKHLDTVSVTATSTETLQRNDSKNNVFPIERIEEMDLNPGLNSPINLETI